MKKLFLSMLALTSILASAVAEEKSFTSPDGKLAVVVEDMDVFAT